MSDLYPSVCECMIGQAVLWPSLTLLPRTGYGGNSGAGGLFTCPGADDLGQWVCVKKGVIECPEGPGAPLIPQGNHRLRPLPSLLGPMPYLL